MVSKKRKWGFLMDFIQNMPVGMFTEPCSPPGRSTMLEIILVVLLIVVALAAVVPGLGLGKRPPKDGGSE